MHWEELHRNMHNHCAGQPARNVVRAAMKLIATSISAAPPEARRAVLSLMQAFVTEAKAGKFDGIEAMREREET